MKLLALVYGLLGILKNNFTLYECITCMHMCTSHAYLFDPWVCKLGLQVFKSPYECWEWNLGPLQEQQMLLAYL